MYITHLFTSLYPAEDKPEPSWQPGPALLPSLPLLQPQGPPSYLVNVPGALSLTLHPCVDLCGPPPASHPPTSPLQVFAHPSPSRQDPPGP